MKVKKFLAAIISLTMMCAGATVSYAKSGPGGPDRYVARIADGGGEFRTLEEAFEKAKDGDTIYVISNINLSEGICVNMKDRGIKDLTITCGGVDNYTITLDILTDDNFKGNEKEYNGLRFEGMTADTNITISNLKIKGTAGIGIHFKGAGYGNLENVTAEGTYYDGWSTNGKDYTYGAVTWTDNCGGTVTDCDINAAFVNGDYNYPLTLKGSTKIENLFANPIQDNKEGQAKVKIKDITGDEGRDVINNLTIGKYTDNISSVMIDPEAMNRVSRKYAEGGAEFVANVNGVWYTSFEEAVAENNKLGDGKNKIFQGSVSNTDELFQAIRDAGYTVNDETLCRADAAAVSGSRLEGCDTLKFVYENTNFNHTVSFDISGTESDGTVTFGVVLYNLGMYSIIQPNVVFE